MVTERLGEYIKVKGVTMYSFEKSINASKASISIAIRKGTNIGSHVLERIFNVYPDLNPTWLLTGKEAMFFTEPVLLVPLYNKSSLTLKSIKPKSFLKIPNISNCHGAVPIKTDCMYPLLNCGDIVLYEKTKKINWDQIHLLHIGINNEEYVTVNYIKKSRNRGFVILAS